MSLSFDPGALLARSYPRTRVVICATALLGSRDTVVGFAASSLDANPKSEPEALVVDKQLTDGLGELLTRALRGRVSALARPRAA